MSATKQHRYAMDRREFLRLSGLLGLGFAAGALPPVSESLAFNRGLYKVTKTRFSMGTVVTITAMHSSKDQAEAAIGRAFEEMDRLTALLDRYRPDSPIGVLNKEGELRDLPPDVDHVICRSLNYHKLSGGTFDVTVQPVVDLYKNHFKAHKRPPSAEDLEKMMRLVDADAVMYDGKAIRFKREGMGITLDGIAKGYIIDQAAKYIKGCGIEHALINAGGDIRAAGGKKNGSPWKVGIENPDKEGPYLDVIKMTDGAIATSGNYEVYFDEEKLYHHIVNPKTGLSPRRITSVTVMAKDVMDADALSTAVFVMKPEAGKRFIESMPATACLIVDREGTRLASTAWPC